MPKLVLNKKKIKINSLFKNFLLFIFLVLSFFLIIFFNLQNFKSYSFNKYVELLSKKFGYTLQEVELNSLNYIRKEDILKHFNNYLSKSIFIVPITDIAEDIENNNWVRSVEIKNNLKNKITINIKESKPVAIYYNGTNFILIDELGRVIDFAKKNDIENYIILEGKNAYTKIKLLLKVIPDRLKPLIIKAHYINNRRWDIYIQDNLKIKLPENDYEKALKVLVDIYDDVYNSNIKKINFIDLRLPNKAIIKFNNDDI